MTPNPPLLNVEQRSEVDRRLAELGDDPSIALTRDQLWQQVENARQLQTDTDQTNLSP
jgi:hypothetical protein